MSSARKRRNTGSSASGPRGSSRARGQTSAPRFDSTRFVSAEAEARYNQKLAKKLLHEVHIDRKALVKECPNMFDELRRCQLDIFFEAPEKANIQLVREFYANLPEHEDKVVTVCNIPVNAAIEVIPRVYRLPAFTGDDYYIMSSRPMVD
ncbi:uncharacterized protein [Nicotiana sylvestris]|uniref:uncharacterized protein n=1 Tax=Nicotiana sylvestris TaxID=4096 RepID=UPI00388C9CA5